MQNISFSNGGGPSMPCREYGFGYIITRSPYTPYSIYLRGTIGVPSTDSMGRLLRNSQQLVTSEDSAMYTMVTRLTCLGRHTDVPHAPAHPIALRI